jgi:hypothetical protein
VDEVSVTATRSAPSAAVPASAPKTASGELDASSSTNPVAGSGGAFTETLAGGLGKLDASRAIRGVGCAP